MIFDVPEDENDYPDNIKLEYGICDVFYKSKNTQIAGFWCDGIRQSECDNHYKIETVKRNKYIKVMAYLGKSGQEHYKLILRMGEKALELYANNLSLVDCLPDNNVDDALDADIPNKTIEITLR